MGKSKVVAEYGDFQTPPGLAMKVCALLAKGGLEPASLLEPTCGLGSFLLAGLEQFPGIHQAVGAEINPYYVEQAKAGLHRRGGDDRVRLEQADFFVTDWKRVICELPAPILVLGNLPWVTNAHLSTLGSQNLPAKSNFQNRNGLDAITGKANCDISEWMLIRLFEAMNGQRGALAILCKSSVARRVLHHAWKNRFTLRMSAVYRIDATRHFDAAVDAVLLVAHFEPGAHHTEAGVYSTLDDAAACAGLGYEGGTLLADICAYHRWKHLCGKEEANWRSGIKHDCSKVMELLREGGKYRNGLGELVELEDAYVYPMLKSSHVASGGRRGGNHWMIVTQKMVGDATADIQENAPKTWAYLKAHAELLNKRGSSIYRKRPEFSIFGVGKYSFAPWKVAISGFYKKIPFTTISPINGKPVVLDDTSYFLPFQTQEQAECVARILNSTEAQSFYSAFIFWDNKRPITADILRRLSVRKLAIELGLAEQLDACIREPEDIPAGAGMHAQLGLWEPDSLDARS